ncbi:hypothetical protein AOQ84DRAFT_417997, partial [Glonium stellatum]
MTGLQGEAKPVTGKRAILGPSEPKVGHSWIIYALIQTAKANRALPSANRPWTGGHQQRLVFVGELLAGRRWRLAAGCWTLLLSALRCRVQARRMILVGKPGRARAAPTFPPSPQERQQQRQQQRQQLQIPSPQQLHHRYAQHGRREGLKIARHT